MADGAAAPARRVKPNNKKAEEAVIGGLYIDNKEIGAVRDLLPDGSYFYNELYGHIYDAILELGKKGSAIDVLTLGEMLREKGVPEEVVSEQFIMDIIDSVPTSANVKHYAKIVSDKALMRDLLRVTEDISEDCYKDSDDVNDLLEKTEKSVFKVVQRRSVGRITPTADIVMRSLESIDKAARATGSITGLPTGFTDLDHKTAGLQAGNLVLVAARPAMGKTSLVLSILQNIVVKQKKVGGAWYYEFMYHGKRYFGTCEGAKSQRQAEAFERTVREKATQASGLKSVKALYETFREDLTGGEKISLNEAFELAERKPRARMPAEKYAGMKRTAWGDFLAFMHGEHPDIVNLADVTDAHAQEYIATLQQTGRYDKTINYKRGTGKKAQTISRQAGGALSARQI